MLDPKSPHKGRGATRYMPNRFDQVAYERDADSHDWEDDEQPSPRTQFFPDSSKSVLATNDSPDIPFTYSLNPYRGCEHGCIYCYARPTHEYLGFSPGLDFETKIMVKHDAPDLLRRELSTEGWAPQTISISGVTDPYQPIERKLEITRRCLEVLAEFMNPAGIVTKNRLVTRDIDVLARLAENNAALVFLTITTLDVKLNRILEPRTSLPQQRLDAIAALTDAGIPTGVMTAPIIPGLNDEEIPAILDAASKAGAKHAGFMVLRLPFAVAPLFESWLEEHLPLKKDRILNRIRSMRGGRMYDAKFGSRMRGEGFHAEQIEKLWSVACRRSGLNETRLNLSTAAFRRAGQLRLFE